MAKLETAAALGDTGVVSLMDSGATPLTSTITTELKNLAACHRRVSKLLGLFFHSLKSDSKSPPSP